MQPKSIPEPERVENERTPADFPTSGDNFVTVMQLGDTPDSLMLLEAFAFAQDCEIALEAFQRELEAKKTSQEA